MIMKIQLMDSTTKSRAGILTAKTVRLKLHFKYRWVYVHMNYLASPESFYQLKLPNQCEFSVCDFVVWMVVDYNLHMIGVSSIPTKNDFIWKFTRNWRLYIQTYK